ncbi:MAG TPA: sigma-70 family RNA polymerase sigma factor [Planctomycetota bacterium]|nr:sigma-70 family RNA polymerase sigma factor [Planctomycetota bacterium]
MKEDLGSLLAAHSADLLLFLRKNGKRLLDRETEEDLLQGVRLRALEHAAEFRYEGREAFFAWLHALARSYLADREKHWSALRRNPGALLRLTAADPASTATGPSTFASRKEQLKLALEALATLLPKDRDLVRWSSEDVPLEDQAARLGVSYDAAKQARLRALERFRKAYELATRRGR